VLRLVPPSHTFGRRILNLVGLTTNAPDKCDPGGLWFEVIPPANLSPRNLHQAQLARRLKQQSSD